MNCLNALNYFCTFFATFLIRFLPPGKPFLDWSPSAQKSSIFSLILTRKMAFPTNPQGFSKNAILFNISTYKNLPEFSIIFWWSVPLLMLTLSGPSFCRDFMTLRAEFNWYLPLNVRFLTSKISATQASPHKYAIGRRMTPPCGPCSCYFY